MSNILFNGSELMAKVARRVIEEGYPRVRRDGSHRWEMFDENADTRYCVEGVHVRRAGERYGDTIQVIELTVNGEVA